MAGAAGRVDETGIDDRGVAEVTDLYEVARKVCFSARLSSQLKHYAMLMAVMMPREKWTDERLDETFARIDADIRELRAEMNAGFREMNARFDAQNRNMMAGFLMVIVTILGSNAF